MKVTPELYVEIVKGVKQFLRLYWSRHGGFTGLHEDQVTNALIAGVPGSTTPTPLAEWSTVNISKADKARFMLSVNAFYRHLHESTGRRAVTKTSVFFSLVGLADGLTGTKPAKPATPTLAPLKTVTPSGGVVIDKETAELIERHEREKRSLVAEIKDLKARLVAATASPAVGGGGGAGGPTIEDKNKAIRQLEQQLELSREHQQECIERKNEAIKDAKESAEHFEEAKRSIEDLTNKLQNTETERDAHHNDLQNTRKEVDFLKEKIKDLEASPPSGGGGGSSSPDVIRELEQKLERSLVDQQECIERKNEAIQNSKESEQHFEEAKRSIEDLTNRLQITEKQRDALQNEVNALQNPSAPTDDIDRLKNEIQLAKSTMDKLRNETVEITRAINKAIKDEEDPILNIENAEEWGKDIRKEIEDCSREKRTLKTAIDTIRTTINNGTFDEMNIDSTREWAGLIKLQLDNAHTAFQACEIEKAMFRSQTAIDKPKIIFQEQIIKGAYDEYMKQKDIVGEEQALEMAKIEARKTLCPPIINNKGTVPASPVPNPLGQPPIAQTGIYMTRETFIDKLSNYVKRTGGIGNITPEDIEGIANAVSQEGLTYEEAYKKVTKKLLRGDASLPHQKVEFLKKPFAFQASGLMDLDDNEFDDMPLAALYNDDYDDDSSLVTFSTDSSF